MITNGHVRIPFLKLMIYQVVSEIITTHTLELTHSQHILCLHLFQDKFVDDDENSLPLTDQHFISWCRCSVHIHAHCFFCFYCNVLIIVTNISFGAPSFLVANGARMNRFQKLIQIERQTHTDQNKNWEERKQCCANNQAETETRLFQL